MLSAFVFYVLTYVNFVHFLDTNGQRDDLQSDALDWGVCVHFQDVGSFPANHKWLSLHALATGNDSCALLGDRALAVNRLKQSLCKSLRRLSTELSCRALESRLIQSSWLRLSATFPDSARWSNFSKSNLEALFFKRAMMVNAGLGNGSVLIGGRCLFSTLVVSALAHCRARSTLLEATHAKPCPRIYEERGIWMAVSIEGWVLHPQHFQQYSDAYPFG